MKMFRKDEEAVSPVIGVILMVAITVILAAVIAAFVFGLGSSQQAAPTASIVAQNNADTSATPDMKIVHRGGDTIKGSNWKLSVVNLNAAPLYVTSMSGYDFMVGNQIALTTETCVAGNLTNTNLTGCGTTLVTGEKYDVKLVHVPTNALILDTVVEVR